MDRNGAILPVSGRIRGSPTSQSWTEVTSPRYQGFHRRETGPEASGAWSLGKSFVSPLVNHALAPATYCSYKFRWAKRLNAPHPTQHRAKRAHINHRDVPTGSISIPPHTDSLPQPHLESTPVVVRPKCCKAQKHPEHVPRPPSPPSPPLRCHTPAAERAPGGTLRGDDNTFLAPAPPL